MSEQIAILAALLLYPLAVLMVAITGPHSAIERGEHRKDEHD